MTATNQLVADFGSARAIAALGDGSLSANDRLDISESVSFFRRRLKMIVAITVAGLAVGLLFSIFSTRIYRASATVMLSSDSAPDVRTGGAEPGKSAINSDFVDSQLEIVTSRAMTERVATSLELKPAEGEDQEDLLAGIRRSVQARRTGESYAINIIYDAPTGEEAAQRANEFARQFANWQLSENRARRAETREILAGRIAELRDQAQSDLQALQHYRIANNLLSTSGASLTEQEISNYNQEVSKARAEAAEDQARLATALAQIRSGSNGDDVGEALSSQVITALRNDEAKAAAEVADLSARYGPNHPQLVRARSQRAEIHNQIQQEIGRVISNLQARREVSSQRLASLQSSLNGAQGKLSQNNEAMVGLSGLQRQAEASQAIYDAYLNNYKELIAAEGSEKPNASIITTASVPKHPASPNVPLNLVVALVIGLGAGILAAYVAESLFDGISTPEQIEKVLGVPHLASIPTLSSVTPDHVHPLESLREERTIFSDSFHALAAAIEEGTHGKGKVIAITSALPDEGKTVLACCLAELMTMRGMRTILIDCDVHRRGVSRLLDVKAGQMGLIDLLKGDTSLNLAAVSGDNVFCILPLPPGREEMQELLTGPEFEKMLADIGQHFDRVILDLPPLLPVPASRVIASRADAVVLAAHWRKTSTHALRAALHQLPKTRANVLGVVLNQVDLRKQSLFDRKDPSFYYTKYSGYYA